MLEKAKKTLGITVVIDVEGDAPVAAAAVAAAAPGRGAPVPVPIPAPVPVAAAAAAASSSSTAPVGSPSVVGGSDMDIDYPDDKSNDETEASQRSDTEADEPPAQPAVLDTDLGRRSAAGHKRGRSNEYTEKARQIHQESMQQLGVEPSKPPQPPRKRQKTSGSGKTKPTSSKERNGGKANAQSRRRVEKTCRQDTQAMMEDDGNSLGY